MGNRSSLLLREEEIAQIQEETGCEFVILLGCLGYVNLDNFKLDIFVVLQFGVLILIC